MSNTLINQAMKRLFKLGLMLASAFALANCAEQLDTPNMENDIIVDVTDHEYGIGDPYIIYIDDVDTKTNYTGGKTVWSEGDKIIVYSKPTGSTEGYVCHGAYTYGKYKTHDSEGKEVTKPGFAGTLKGTLDKMNDWFFVYNGSDSENVTLQPSTDQEPAEDGMKYVMENCPLWGLDNRVSKKDNPRFKMKYPYAVAAIEITNKTPGKIVVASAGIKATEDIVGEFTIDNSGKLTKINDKTSSTATTTIKNAPISSANTQTFYIPVKPFTAAAGKKLTVYVNGSYRDIKLEKELKFEAGKITTITVPVEKLYFHDKDVDPATSNVMDVKVQVFDKISGSLFSGYKLNYKEGLAVTTSNSSTADVVINGKQTKAYVIGTESSVGTVSIHGTAKELIAYMPMEFYAAAWDNKDVVQDKAVMRVESVTIHTDLTAAMIMSHKLSLDYSTLTSMMDGGKITFSGLLPLEQVTHNDKSHMIILDEEPYHKPISVDKFETLLASFDNDPKDNFKPTFEGLKEALINPGNLRSSYDLTSSNLTEAEITAYTMWKKIKSKVDGNSLLSFASAFTGDVLKTPKGMFEFASKSPIDAVLTTLPAGGEEGATDNRLIFWGLNSPEVK